MVEIEDVYANTLETDFTINFFRAIPPRTSRVFFATPFFSTYEPIKLVTDEGCEVLLIVRLCPITSPSALRAALQDRLVKVRYFTGERFHTKLYIAGDYALVGSANLTDSGLKSNREVSVTLRRTEHPAFEQLESIFQGLWDRADVLTEGIWKTYDAAFRTNSGSRPIDPLDQAISRSIPACEPRSTLVGSDKVSKERIFLQSFRRKYDEVLGPAIDEIKDVLRSMGERHPAFARADFEIEINRFLGWLRVQHAPGESWRGTKLGTKAEREMNVVRFLREWVEIKDAAVGDVYSYDVEFANVVKLRAVFGSRDAIGRATAEEIADALAGCHAFREQLRFTRGGLLPLKEEFISANSLEEVRRTFIFLLHGAGDQVQRAYDCIYGDYKLHRFAEACVMELVGWMDPERTPINGRTIKALRFLGFDTE